jgi:ribokinase
MVQPWHEAVVVTAGRAGAWAVDRSNPSPLRVPAFHVHAIDTTGCGDVFHGAYAEFLARGLSLKERVIRASAAAALKATRAGGQSGAPRLTELEAFLAKAARQGN